MQTNLYNTTLALAGILQCIGQVKEIAQAGQMNESVFQTCIGSLFQMNPTDVPAVYGNLTNLKYGLEKIVQGFDVAGEPARSSQTRYLMSLLHLQRKISRSPKMLNTLTQRLQQTQKQVEYFYLIHPTVISNLADIYLSTISTFKFRIIIWGNQRVLTAPDNMNRIRALLLAGIRSVVLWRQVGGSRLQLLFGRAKIKAMAEKILKEIEHKDIL